MRQRRLYSPTSVQNGAVQLSCNVGNGAFSVCRPPFVRAILFHMVISIYTQSIDGRAFKAVNLHLLLATIYFWDTNEQRLLYMFTLAD